jgi:hypothetical protein
VLGLVLAFGIDWIRYTTGLDWIGWLNFGFVWLTAHQLGYRWATEAHRPATAPLVAGIPLAVGALLVLTLAGPYPISMVGGPGATDNNTLPPTAALVVLSLLQYAVIRLAEPAARRWMHRKRPWTFVVGFHAVMMTVYVWHLPTLARVRDRFRVLHRTAHHCLVAHAARLDCGAHGCSGGRDCTTTPPK